MAKKEKLGTIKVTRNVTLIQNINLQQRCNQHVSINSSQEQIGQAEKSEKVKSK